MSTIAEIEAAIEKLPASQIDELTRWLEALRGRSSRPPVMENWIARARGAAALGATTGSVMALTGGEQ